MGRGVEAGGCLSVWHASASFHTLLPRWAEAGLGEAAPPNPERRLSMLPPSVLDMHAPTSGISIPGCLHLPPRFLSKAPQLPLPPSLSYLPPVCCRGQKNLGFLHCGRIPRALSSGRSCGCVTLRKRGRNIVVLSRMINGLAQ